MKKCLKYIEKRDNKREISFFMSNNTLNNQKMLAFLSFQNNAKF